MKRLEKFMNKYNGIIMFLILIPISMFIAYKISYSRTVIELNNKITELESHPTPSVEQGSGYSQELSDIHYDLQVMNSQLNQCLKNLNQTK